jgi:hypothetical protein
MLVVECCPRLHGAGPFLVYRLMVLVEILTANPNDFPKEQYPPSGEKSYSELGTRNSEH